VFPGVQERFTKDELQAIEDYLNEGGHVIFLFDESQDANISRNVNFLLEQFGIAVQTDSVIRTVYHKGFYHPKVLVTLSSLPSPPRVHV
jgi:intraflagellar transport protein 52